MIETTKFPASDPGGDSSTSDCGVTYRTYGLATVRYLVLEIEARVEARTDAGILFMRSPLGDLV